jgi:hypothetical protein
MHLSELLSVDPTFFVSFQDASYISYMTVTAAVASQNFPGYLNYEIRTVDRISALAGYTLRPQTD